MLSLRCIEGSDLFKVDDGTYVLRIRSFFPDFPTKQSLRRRVTNNLNGLGDICNIYCFIGGEARLRINGTSIDLRHEDLFIVAGPTAGILSVHPGVGYELEPMRD